MLLLLRHIGPEVSPNGIAKMPEHGLMQAPRGQKGLGEQSLVVNVQQLYLTATVGCSGLHSISGGQVWYEQLPITIQMSACHWLNDRRFGR